jgi:hypothetical protein
MWFLDLCHRCDSKKRARPACSTALHTHQYSVNKWPIAECKSCTYHTLIINWIPPSIVLVWAYKDELMQQDSLGEAEAAAPEAYTSTPGEKQWCAKKQVKRGKHKHNYLGIKIFTCHTFEAKCCLVYPLTILDLSLVDHMHDDADPVPEETFNVYGRVSYVTLVQKGIRTINNKRSGSPQKFPLQHGSPLLLTFPDQSSEWHVHQIYLYMPFTTADPISVLLTNHITVHHEEVRKRCKSFVFFFITNVQTNQSSESLHIVRSDKMIRDTYMVPLCFVKRNINMLRQFPDHFLYLFARLRSKRKKL